MTIIQAIGRRLPEYKCPAETGVGLVRAAPRTYQRVGGQLPALAGAASTQTRRCPFYLPCPKHPSFPKPCKSSVWVCRAPEGGWGRAEVRPCRRSRAGCLSAAAANPHRHFSGPRAPLYELRGATLTQQRMETGEAPLLAVECGASAPPLTLASASHQVVKQMLDRTSSGNFAGNQGFTFLTLTSLPFGGVGEPRPPDPHLPAIRGSR